MQLASYVMLARILAPSDFGIVAMVTVVVGFATIFADFGLSLAAIREAELTPAQKSNLFWSNALVGAICMGLVAASGPLLAEFYNEPALISVTLALSIGLLTNAVAVQFRVELNRRRAFGLMAAQEVTGSVLGLVAALVVALAGLGYWALVVQTLTQSLVILLLAVIQARWFPGLPSRNARMRSLFAFGRDTLLLQLAYYASRSVDSLAIGRTLGPEALGFYSRGSQIVTLAFQQILSPLTRVVLPRLSAASSSDELNSQLLRVHKFVSFAIVGLLGVLIAVAEPLIVVALGENWRPMAGVVQVLGTAAIFQALAYVYYWAFLATARTGVLLLSELPGRLVMIAGSIALVRFGVEAVAWAIVAGQVLMFVTGAFVANRSILLDSLTLIRASLRPAAATALATVAGILVVSYSQMQLWAPVLVLTVAAATWAAVWSACMLLSPVSRADIKGVVSDVLKR